MVDPSKDEKIIVPLLAKRSCHLPGNGWCGDWCQFMRNNHILFGICFHHPWHPLEWWERTLSLVGSVSFGMATTGFVYLWAVVDPDFMDETVLTLDEPFGITEDGKYVITKGMISLWTFGGMLHSVFDFFVWNIMACACCHPGGRCGSCICSDQFKDCGSCMLLPVILLLVGFAIVVVFKRASLEHHDAVDVDDDYFLNLNDIEDARSYAFMIDYCVELCLAWFVYFPLNGTIIFSGMLGCDGKLPVLGGRPRDKRLFEENKKYSRMP